MKDLYRLFLTEPTSFERKRWVSSNFMATQSEQSPYRLLYQPAGDGRWEAKANLQRRTAIVLPKPWRRAYRGPMVLIVGPNTFSACSDFAAALMATREDVEVIGRESRGGARRLYGGQFTHYRLPNSSIFFQVPIVAYDAPASFGELHRGVVPHIAIENRPDTREDETAICAMQRVKRQACVSAKLP